MSIPSYFSLLVSPAKNVDSRIKVASLCLVAHTIKFRLSRNWSFVLRLELLVFQDFSLSSRIFSSSRLIDRLSLHKIIIYYEFTHIMFSSALWFIFASPLCKKKHLDGGFPWSAVNLTDFRCNINLATI